VQDKNVKIGGGGGVGGGGGGGEEEEKRGEEREDHTAAVAAVSKVLKQVYAEAAQQYQTLVASDACLLCSPGILALASIKLAFEVLNLPAFDQLLLPVVALRSLNFRRGTVSSAVADATTPRDMDGMATTSTPSALTSRRVGRVDGRVDASTRLVPRAESDVIMASVDRCGSDVPDPGDQEETITRLQAGIATVKTCVAQVVRVKQKVGRAGGGGNGNGNGNTIDPKGLMEKYQKSINPANDPRKKVFKEVQEAKKQAKREKDRLKYAALAAAQKDQAHGLELSDIPRSTNLQRQGQPDNHDENHGIKRPRNE